MVYVHKKKQSLPEMDARLRRIAEQLTEQTELHNSSAQRAQLAGQQVQGLREKVQALEKELLSADVHREKLLNSRQHVSQVVLMPPVAIGCENPISEECYKLPDVSHAVSCSTRNFWISCPRP